MADSAGRFELIEENAAPVLRLTGDWTVDFAAPLRAQLEAASLPRPLTLDVTGLTDIDLAGAYLLHRALGGEAPRFIGEHDTAERLIAVAAAADRPDPPVTEQARSLHAFLEGAGRYAHSFYEEAMATLSFFGRTLVAMGNAVKRPHRIRWTSVAHVAEVAGLDALPIVATLSFFVGLVVAYLGARTLADFGASVFTVELVGVSVMREFAVVITCVLLAGRTDSAFTAEIGAMKMRQEVDAMRVIGLDPMEALVVPRVIAMILMTPVLTFGAMLSGMLGGVVACWAYLDVSPVMFFSRIQDGVPAQHFFVGMIKAPVFAVVLAVVGCRHGLATGGDVGSLGRRVTASVVEAIFVIIALDALFAIWFMEMDL